MGIPELYGAPRLHAQRVEEDTGRRFVLGLVADGIDAVSVEVLARDLHVAQGASITGIFRDFARSWRGRCLSIVDELNEQ